MNLLANLIYGFVSGIAEFLPISSSAHQTILDHMLHLDGSPQLRSLFIHLGLLAALFVRCANLFSRFDRERRRATRRLGRAATADRFTWMELRFVRTAAVPMVIGYVVLRFVGPATYSLGSVALFLVINGLILYLPEHLIRGNKGPRSMSALDALLVGICSALGSLTGISRIGCGTCAALSRGADRSYALNWALLLSAPALIVLIVLDLIMVITQGLGIFSFLIFISCLVSAAAAFAGAYVAIGMIRLIGSRTGYSSFAYYAWGAALFSIILSLIV